jgi:tetratricopeptide (TPR) repeat protein
MINISKRHFKASVLLGLVLFLCSCASYNEKIAGYYKQISEGNYAAANQELDKNSLLQKPRNKLLFLMEKGKTCHLNGDYENSNNYFNQADSLLENGLGGVGDALVGTLVNPMTQTYKGEDFEKFMIHYYKALNYLYLHKREDAIVEARRISLQSQDQEDKFNSKDNRYSKDAFSLTLQGLIYESDGDVNNAFIAYRNAAEVYLSSKDKAWYGTSMPETLKMDVLRTASLNGFKSELAHFEELFGLTYQAKPASDGGELIFFWENGLAPVKQQEEFFFSLIHGNDGNLVFSNATGTIFVPYNSSYGSDDINLNAVESLRATYPKYVAQPVYFSSAALDNGKLSVNLEKTEDINELAFKTLAQRFPKEMSKILTRLAVKKSAEYILKESAKKNGKNGKDNALLEGLGFGMQLYSLISEKADTRNWQSLPAEISYARIPLQKGENTITLNLKGTKGDEVRTIHINGTGRMQFYNYSTLR